MIRRQAKRKIVLLGILLLAALALAVFGLDTPWFSLQPLRPNLGLDIEGGLVVYLEAEDTPEIAVTEERMDQAVAALNRRVNAMNMLEPEIVREGERRIKVALPGVRDAEEALEMIGRRAFLEIKNPHGETVLSGADLADARAMQPTDGSAPYIALTLQTEAQDLFAALTTEFLGLNLPIYLDGEQIMNPRIADAGLRNPMITGIGSYSECVQMATLLRSGSLPIQFAADPAVYRIGPLLGRDSLQQSLLAGLIGAAAILIFMLLIYRICGLIADIALLVYLGLTLFVFVQLGATLTLSGIAGIILSLGMAVDTNILIFERIREELRAGTALRPSVRAGFAKAFTAIIDSNITTLIASGLLYYFGSDQIKGFAITLMLGIAISMFTAVTFTRFLLQNLIDSGWVRDPKRLVHP